MEELEQMREQLTILKNKLDQQEIISDKMLRSITSERVKRLNRAIWWEGTCCLFVITAGSLIFRHMGCSLSFIIATIIMMIGCFLATIIPHHWIDHQEIMSGSLKEVVQQVKKLHLFYHNWLYIAIPLVLAWFGWLAWEIYQVNNGDMHAFWGIMVGGCVGGLIGGIIGNHQRKTYMHEMETIIQSIEE